METQKILKGIYDKYPNLTYQNKGYDELDYNKLTDMDKKAYRLVSLILKDSINGFVRFQNFCIGKKTGEVILRLQYNYNYDGGIPFTGVGYFELKHF